MSEIASSWEMNTSLVPSISSAMLPHPGPCTSGAMSPPSRDPSSVNSRVLDPALKAAYTTERRVITIPAARVVPEAAVMVFPKPLHS